MAHHLERLSRIDRTAAAWLIAAAAAVVLLWWLVPRAPAPGGAATEQSLVVEPRPFVASIGFTGTVVPGDGQAVIAPFDGTVKAIGFAYGDRVVPGQMLMELDLAELEQSRNDAESAYLKAAQTAAEMRDWDSGPEVSRARRASASASFDLGDTERQLRETKALLDRGLVSRSEYDGLVQQRRTQHMSAIAAQEDLKSTLLRGRGANRRAAALELENARARLATLNGQFASAIVRAAAAGIIVRPPASRSGPADDELHVGRRLSKGQLVGSIARAGGLAVTFNLDEADVGRVSTGQAVTVTGPGFPGLSLPGRIGSIAGEATAQSFVAGGKPSFTATASLDPLTPEQASQVRIGMSATIAITTYSNPRALVVPPQAVRGAAPAASVLVRDRAGGDPRQVTVQIGQVAPDGVEILSGLKPGETVVWTIPAPPELPAL